jgi:peptide/nickel transport system substrate-binding protein
MRWRRRRRSWRSSPAIGPTSTSRAPRPRLLKEAGHPTSVHPQQPWRRPAIVGTWLIDQWKQVGITVDQKVEATGPFYASLDSGNFDVTMDFNCQSIVNPLSDTSKFLPNDGAQYGKFEDPELNKMYEAMNRTGDEAEQKRLMRAYEKRVLDEQAYNHITLWWYRIIAHRSYMKGWKITPSHYLNQDLSGVWIDK